LAAIGDAEILVEEGDAAEGALRPLASPPRRLAVPGADHRVDLRIDLLGPRPGAGEQLRGAGLARAHGPGEVDRRSREIVVEVHGGPGSGAAGGAVSEPSRSGRPAATRA